MRYFASSLLLGLLGLGCASSSAGGGGGSDTTTKTFTLTPTSTTTTTTSGTFTGQGGGAVTTTSTSGAGGAGGGSTGTSYDAGVPAHGDCLGDTDCPGGACVELTPGGFRVCATPPADTATCGSAEDQCCPGYPCAGGEPCYEGPLVPICGGAPLAPSNQCAVDQCTQDADCTATQICGVAGALGHQIRACIAAACKVDADCAAGSVCAPVLEPCCGTLAGLYCVPLSGGCRSNADCKPTQFCQVAGASATCQPGVPACPP